MAAVSIASLYAAFSTSLYAPGISETLSRSNEKNALLDSVPALRASPRLRSRCVVLRQSVGRAPAMSP